MSSSIVFSPSDPFDEDFAASVGEGLSSPEKWLSSRFFYDAEGDRIFQAIMASPEYYLTDAEFEILDQQGSQVAKALSGGEAVEFLELGSGDGLKSQLLIDAFHHLGIPLVYRPLDISANALDLLCQRIGPSRPWLAMDPIHGDYHDVLPALPPAPGRRVVGFLGSNIGNYPRDEALNFLRLVRDALGDNDRFLVGLDLKKDPAIIEAAYNDAAGHTREFNLNLLRRINRELGGNFDIECFEHRPTYNPETGAAESWLLSTRDQEVTIAALGRSYSFEAGERIAMEISQKFDADMIGALSAESGFEVEHSFIDSRGWFTDQVWRPRR